MPNKYSHLHKLFNIWTDWYAIHHQEHARVPIPGASPMGRLAKKPMMKDETRDATAVAVIRLNLNSDKHCCASGSLLTKRQEDPRTLYSWTQESYSWLERISWGTFILPSTQKNAGVVEIKETAVDHIIIQYLTWAEHNSSASHWPPVASRIDGFTASTYAIIKKEIVPALNSVLNFDLRSLRVKNFPIYVQQQSNGCQTI